MTFWRCHYHIVWTTLNRASVLTPERESIVARCIASVADDKSVILHAFGMVSDHVHIAASIPPNIAMSDIIKTIKGSSSHQLRGSVDAMGQSWPGWQGEFGVPTFGDQSFERVVAYVRDQKQHHDEGTILSAFERIDREGFAKHESDELSQR
jgi:putative transposase